MKVAIYSPYLDTFGGGERYVLTIAEVLSSEALVELLFDSYLYSLGAESLKKDLAERFGLDLSKVSVCKAPLGKGTNPVERFLFFKKYDILFYLTDGSIFYPSSKKNILHIQSPLPGEPAKSLWGKFKLRGWDLIIYNSEFTEKNSCQNWPIASKVIYPPVDTAHIKPLKKRNYILSVGRFFGYLKDKKQEVLIGVFRNLYENGLIKDWSLHLVGSAGEGDEKYLDQLRNLAKGVPVKFYPNLKYDHLRKLYGQSSIYWHAAGFGETDPTKMEHFGISTVEAMAAGSVPVVVNKGGLTEIVENGKNGFLWDSLKELEDYTTLLIKDQNLQTNLSQNASLTSHKFSKIRFEEVILNLLKNLP